MTTIFGRARRVAALGVLAFGMLGVFATSAHAAQPSAEADFVARINEVRAQNGAGPLSVDDQLVAVARTWTDTMVAAGDISHNPNLSGLITDWHHIGENVGMGPNIDSLETAFVNSPHHFANMVDPTFTRIGVGVSMAPDGTMFVTEDYKTPSGAPVASVARTVTTHVTAPPRPVVTTPRPVVTVPAKPKPAAAPVAAPVPTPAPAPAPVVAAVSAAKPPRPVAQVWQAASGPGVAKGGHSARHVATSLVSDVGRGAASPVGQLFLASALLVVLALPTKRLAAKTSSSN